MDVLVSFALSKKRLHLQDSSELYSKILESFGLRKEEYFLQAYDKTFEEYVDIADLNDISDGLKIKIVRNSDQALSAAFNTASTSDQNKLPNVDSSLVLTTTLEPQQSSTSNPLPSTNNPLPSSSSSGLSSTHNSHQSQQQNRREQWPDKFPINEQHFSCVLIEALKQKQQNEPLAWAPRTELTQNLCNTIYRYTAYPSIRQREEVCKELISRYPQMKETIGSGYAGLQEAINNRMKKMRHDLQNIKEEVRVVKRAYKLGQSPGKAKVPKRGELNWAPDHLDGEDKSSNQKHKEKMRSEIKKSDKSPSVKKSMEVTFSFRRDFINKNPKLSEIKDEYPALFTPCEQFCEFQRLTQIEPAKLFNDNVLKISREIVSFVKRRGQKKSHAESILAEFETRTKDSTPETALYHSGVAALQLVPGCLGEDVNQVFRFEETAKKAKEIGAAAVEPMLVCVGSPYETELFTIYGENQMLIETEEFFTAVCSLLCLYYSCNIAYPKKLRNTYSFMQHKLLGLTGKGCAPCPSRVVTFIGNLQKRC